MGFDGSAFSKPAGEVNLEGFTPVTVGGAGTTYPISQYSNDLGAALVAAMKASNAAYSASGYAYQIIIESGVWKPLTQAAIPPGTVKLYIIGRGAGVTVIEPPRNLGNGNDKGPAFLSTNGWSTPTLFIVGELTFSGTLQTASPAPATTNTPTAVSNVYTYVHGTAYSGAAAVAPAYVQATGLTSANTSAVTLTQAAPNGTGVAHTPAGATQGALLRLLSLGIYMNVGDTLTVTSTDSAPTIQYQYSNEYVNLTSQASLQGNESSATCYINNIETISSSHIGYSGTGGASGAAGSCIILDGCEDSIVLYPRIRSAGAIQCVVYSGAWQTIGGFAYSIVTSANEYECLGTGIGSGSLIVVPDAKGATAATFSKLILEPSYANGPGAANPGLILNPACNLYVSIDGTWLLNSSGGSATAWIGSTTTSLGGLALGMANVTLRSKGAVFAGGTSSSALFASAPAVFSGEANLTGSATTAGALTNLTAAIAPNLNLILNGVQQQAFPPMAPLSGNQASVNSTVASSTLTSCGINNSGTVPSFTPNRSGKVIITLNFTLANSSTTGVAAQIGVTTGTITPGTTTITGGQGRKVSQSTTVANVTYSFCLVIEFAGTAGTTYNWDLFIGDVTSTNTVTCTLTSWTVQEVPSGSGGL